MDPLNDMKRFISQTKKHSEGHSTSTGRVPLIASAPALSSHSSRSSLDEHSVRGVDGQERRKSHDHKHHKEHKSKSKHKKKGKEREKEARLEELRRQRRKREEAERAKADIMLRQRHSQDGKEGQVSSAPQVVEDIAGRYVYDLRLP